MNKFIKSASFLFLTSAVITGCQSPTKISDQDCISLIKGITETPFKPGMEVEGDYYTVFERAGEKEVADCLVSQVTNTEPVNYVSMSPGPHPQFVVGDISAFMLADMYDIPFTTFLNKDAWDRMGVHEYYRYAQTDGAREAIAQILRPIVKTKFD